MSVRREDRTAMTARPPGREQWRHVLLISAVALALYAGIRRLPTGTSLSHMDFRAGGGGVEFCDPANPQFIPVVAVRSPVTMTLAGDAPAVTGREVRVVATLKTSTGKAVAPEDLLIVHTQKLHLLVIDPTLSDYQHVHPSPGETPGTWEFVFTPRRAGPYRIFADFTPAATARGLYASADLVVDTGVVETRSNAGRADGPSSVADDAEHRPYLRTSTSIQAVLPLGEAIPAVAQSSASDPRTYELNGYTFELQPATEPLRAGRVIDLTFTVSRRDGGAVPLQPVMGAYAHLVAFDTGRSGFAHLHPNEADLSRVLDPRQPRLTFKVTIPRAGRYVIWSQVNLGGEELFAPFWLEVAP